MQITEKVFLAGSGENGIFLTDALDCNCYLVDCGSGYVLIDTGVGRKPERIDAVMRSHMKPGLPLLAVLITHCHGDHAGGIQYFRDAYGAQVVAPAAEAAIIRNGDEVLSGLDVARAAGFYPAEYRLFPRPVDREVAPGDVFSVGKLQFQVLEAAGHSIGGVCYCTEADGKRLLFAGDLISFGGHISLQLIPGADVHAYARSVKALSKLRVDQFFPGHGLFVLQDGWKQVQSAADGFDRLFVPV